MTKETHESYCEECGERLVTIKCACSFRLLTCPLCDARQAVQDAIVDHTKDCRAAKLRRRAA